jgi:uncharacterized protein YbjT (DUF2867 family)
MSYTLVIGPTGNIGQQLVKKLQQRSSPLLLAVKSRQPQWLRPRDIFLSGDLMDADFLNLIVAKADSLFLILPGTLYDNWEAFTNLIAAAIRNSSIRHIVTVTNAVTSKSGKPTLLKKWEEKLEDLLPCVAIRHLRCANFFSNLNWGFSLGYRPDLKLPYISTHEVADVAADLLTHSNFSGHVAKELLGPGDYSMEQLARFAGYDYQQIPFTGKDAAFFEGFNRNDFTIASRNRENSTSVDKPEYYLDYFFAHEFIWKPLPAL